MENALIWIALLGAAISIVTFWLNFNDRIEKGKKEAAKALAEAQQEADAEINKLRDAQVTQIAALQGQISMFRERVAADYITRDVLEKFEDRVVKRLESAIEHLGERLDQAFLGKARK